MCSHQISLAYQHVKERMEKKNPPNVQRTAAIEMAMWYVPAISIPIPMPIVVNCKLLMHPSVKNMY